MAKRIGELLEEFKLIDHSQLEQAIEEQKRTGEKIGDVIIRRGMVSAEDLENILARQHSLPTLNLEKYTPSPEAIATVPERYMRDHMIIPVEKTKKVLTVVMANPRDFEVMDELRFMTGKLISPVVASHHSILRALDRLFPQSSKKLSDARTVDFKADFSTETAEAAQNLLEFVKRLNHTPVNEAARCLLATAAKSNAESVHIQLTEGMSKVRFRIEGTLTNFNEAPQKPMLNLVKRLKKIFNLDEESHSARLTHLYAKLGGTNYDLGLSILPTNYGESLVINLDKALAVREFTLDVLGMYPEVLASYREIIKARSGLILYASPLGSGKTTTIYATLDALKKPGQRTVTVESPVRRKLADIEQLDFNEVPGLDEGYALQALMNQDVDRLFVGDVTNPIALQSALRASQQGMMVMGRADYPGALSFLDRAVSVLGVAPTLLTSSLLLIMGQRVLDMLCSHCLEPAPVPQNLVDRLKRLTGRRSPQFYTAKGCVRCNGTGKMGRVALFELYQSSDRLKQLLVSRTPEHKMRSILSSEGTRTLLDDGLMKASDGLVSYQDVLSAM